MGQESEEIAIQKNQKVIVRRSLQKTWTNVLKRSFGVQVETQYRVDGNA